MRIMTAARTALYALLAFAAGAAAVSALALGETRQRIKRLEAEHRLAETRHGVIEYISWGEGAPVLVVHGAGGGFDQGRLLAEAMGPYDMRYISVSRFGYLGSALPETASTGAQAEAFADLLDALGIERVSILAMSGGAPPSLKFAELFPERVSRMALLSPAPFTPFSPDVDDRPIPTWAYTALLGNDIAYWTLTKLARHQLEEAFDVRRDLRKSLSRDEKAFAGTLIDTFLPASRRLAGIMNEGAAVDPATSYDLEAVQTPILVVHARDDRLNPFAVAEAIAERAPHARLIGLETGGHLLLGHHETVRRDVSAFLRE